MKTKIIFTIFSISLIIGLIFQLLRLQDFEWDQYSNEAKQECENNKDKVLIYDRKLNYWECVD